MRRTRHITSVLLAASAFVSSPAWADPSPTSDQTAHRTVDTMSLRMMLQKGIISQAEYDSAIHDMLDTAGSRGGADTTNLVIGKWSATLYGFVDADYIQDSTQSFTDLAGSGQVAREGTYAGGNPRSQFSIRNSRVGFRFRAPEYHQIRATAQIETDFLGAWANPTYSGATGQPSENQYFTNPVLRVRHMILKIENPVVDVTFGQTWTVFGGAGLYQPNTVQYQGVPGEVYARTPQLRLSRTLGGSGPVSFDIIAAAMRAPNRDSGLPEGQGALRIAFNKWNGVQTFGATGTTLSPLSIAVSGDVRQLAISNFPQDVGAKSAFDTAKTGGAVAVDAFIPIIPGSKEHSGNSLSLLGEFVTGKGINDLYTGLGSGIGYPTPVAPAGSTTAVVPYNPQIDPGLVTIDPHSGQVGLVEVQTIRAGVQYYFPGVNGKMWLSANYANVTIPNAPTLATFRSTEVQGTAAVPAGPGGTPAAVAATPSVNSGKPISPATLRNSLNFFDVMLMGDLTPAVRLGLEYAYYADKYLDGVSGIDHRVQASAFYIF